MDSFLNLANHAHSTLPLDVLAALTLLSVAPFVLVMSTSFVRIVVVLSLVRSAIGAAALPPNTVITGVALVLTFVIMSPTIQAINQNAIVPYSKGKIKQSEFISRAARPLRSFMLRQTRTKDIALFSQVARRPAEAASDSPTYVLIPALSSANYAAPSQLVLRSTYRSLPLIWRLRLSSWGWGCLCSAPRSSPYLLSSCSL